MTLAVAALVTHAKSTVASSLVSSVVILGYPILDTLLAVIRRALRGQSLFSADRGHIHHRLLAKGWDHAGAALLVYVVCALLGVLALGIVLRQDFWVVGAVAAVTGILLLGAKVLGYFDRVSLGDLQDQRLRYRAAYFFAQMIEAKLDMVSSAEEVFSLARESCCEFEMQSLDLLLSPLDSRRPKSSHWRFEAGSEAGVPPGTAAPLKTEHFTFKDSGLTVVISFGHTPATEDLMLYRRQLLFEILKAADARLLALPAEGPESVDGDNQVLVLSGAHPGGASRILVADQDETLVQAIAGFLREHGYEIDCACAGA